VRRRRNDRALSSDGRLDECDEVATRLCMIFSELQDRICISD
jgi:hypothetical protein